ncbi:beta-glucosidase [Vallitalea longa]|uniref:Beta-glucosidase n=1 Tax=Vallitalea longa TaxID=2936439 RepID=A0A9W5YCC7_9FIRM|nr:glycoside hydrolase family 3 N-terminal domain-containing protein [Vallitalea longa]GKX29738.1 beta-glucosidase [Vallitalea longa]
MNYKYKNPNLSPIERAEDLLSLMTLEEKVGQLNQKLYGFSIYEKKDNSYFITDEFKDEVKKWSGLGFLYGLYRSDPWSKKNYKSGIPKNKAMDIYNEIQRYVIEHSRLGIPVLITTECPHGHQSLDSYLLPVNLAMGATFNTRLIEKAFGICAKDVSTMNVDFALVSVLDVLRDPRWGRSEECFGEDPYLVSEFARAVIKGLQENGVYAVAKHFCGQGECTGGVNASAARIGERELREIHLPPAEAVCSEGVKGIMAAYNEIDGIPCHANKYLLRDVLKSEYGFDGIVMADGVAIDRLDIMTGNNVKSGGLALNSGIDVSLWDNGFTKLTHACNNNFVSMETIDSAVKKVLTIKFERGLFDDPYIKSKPKIYSYSDYDESLQISRESVVLLENKNDYLPVDVNQISSIAVIGPNADNLYNQLGDYTPYVKEKDGITVYEGIKDYIKSETHKPIKVEYCEGINNTGKMDSNKLQQAIQLSRKCDVTILVLGGTSSRFNEVKFDNNGAAIIDETNDGSNFMDCGEGIDCASLALPENQSHLAEYIYKNAKKVVTIMIQGRPYIINNIVEESDSVLSAFYPGMRGGQALAEIIFGKISPSGRLPVSIPRHAGQIPSYYNYKLSYDAMNYYDMKKGPLYTFGYGLTYSNLIYSNIKLSKDKISKKSLDKENITLEFEIKNDGNYDTYAVPQLYIRDVQASVIRRVRELKSFQKVWIPKNKTVSVSLEITKESLCLWDYRMQKDIEEGEFLLYLSDNGTDYLSGILRIIGDGSF